MSLTEHDLREIFAERTATLHADAGLAAVVAARAASARRARLWSAAAVAAAGLVVLGLVTSLVRTGQGQVDPAAGGSGGSWVVTAPEGTGWVTRVATLDGLRLTTRGSTVVVGHRGAPGAPGAADVVTLEVANTSDSPWHGVVGVGLCSDAVDDQFGDPRFHPTVMTPVESRRDLVQFASASGAGVLEGVTDDVDRTLAPGEEVTLTFETYNGRTGYPGVRLHGWLPVLDPFQALGPRRHPDCGSYGVIAARP